MPAPQRRDAGRQAERTPTLHIPETAVEYYCNQLQILVTDWDFTLLIGVTELPDEIALAGGPGGQVSVTGSPRVEAVIRTSPLHAKAMMEALRRTIANYEEAHGELRLPNQEGGGG